MQRLMIEAAKLDDGQLLNQVGKTKARWNQASAELVALVSEIDHRKLGLKQGFSSTFAFCTQRLGMSESRAVRTIKVARLARRFPIVLDGLRSGTFEGAAGCHRVCRRAWSSML